MAQFRISSACPGNSRDVAYFRVQMALIDHPGEWLRLTDHYRRMTDGELMAIARDREQLTEIARQILAIELSARRLKVEAENPRPPAFRGASPTTPDAPQQNGELRSSAQPTPPVPASGQEQSHGETAADPYAEDRKLVELLTIWSLRDAMQVQRLLDVAGIPFYMGAENATGVDAVTSNFATGVSVKIMRIGLPWARQALGHYEPKDEPESEKETLDEAVDVRCPRCRTTDIIFHEEVPSDGASRKYKWKCDVCGNQWEDDGVAAQ